MKIISEGNIPPPSNKWWVGQKICCGFCSAEFILEEGDRVAEVIEKTLNGGILVRFHCPICTQSLTHEKPISRKENSWKNEVSQKHLIKKPNSSTLGEQPNMRSRIHPSVSVLEPELNAELEEIDTHPIARLEPDLEKSPSPPLLEDEWGNKDSKLTIFPWKWLALAVLLIVSIIVWSKIRISP
jgi:hypothetical protein